MRVFTIDDVLDTLHKFKQRGLGFLLSKLNIYGIKRTKDAFDQLNYVSADWWIIPKIKERWNLLITGNKNLDYKKYFVDHYLNNKTGLRLISIGSGACQHEIELAKYSNFIEIICLDIAKEKLFEAETKANELKLKNIKFICADLYTYAMPKEYFDVFFFNSSLHHINHIDDFVKQRIKPSLKINGLLVINEYVGATRLQFPKHQIKKINDALNKIPNEFKYRYKSNLLKKRYYGSGIFRMILADPSECVDSARILPSIHLNFHAIIEKPYGGNILMNVLKDISHHFVQLDDKKNKILEDLFLFEDKYLTNYSSDFIFGIYQKRSSNID